MTLLGLVLIAIVTGICALIPAGIASAKGRNFLWWWIYSYGFFPVALIHICTMESEVGTDPKLLTPGRVGERIGELMLYGAIAIAFLLGIVYLNN